MLNTKRKPVLSTHADIPSISIAESVQISFRAGFLFFLICLANFYHRSNCDIYNDLAGWCQGKN